MARYHTYIVTSIDSDNLPEGYASLLAQVSKGLPANYDNSFEDGVCLKLKGVQLPPVGDAHPVTQIKPQNFRVRIARLLSEKDRAPLEALLGSWEAADAKIKEKITRIRQLRNEMEEAGKHYEEIRAMERVIGHPDSVEGADYKSKLARALSDARKGDILLERPFYEMVERGQRLVTVEIEKKDENSRFPNEVMAGDKVRLVMAAFQPEDAEAFAKKLEANRELEAMHPLLSSARMESQNPGKRIGLATATGVQSGNPIIDVIEQPHQSL